MSLFVTTVAVAQQTPDKSGAKPDCTDLSGTEHVPCPAPASKAEAKRLLAAPAKAPVANAATITALPMNVLRDEKDFFTSPARVRVPDFKFILPFAGITAGLLATDTDIEKHLPTSNTVINKSRTFSD